MLAPGAQIGQYKLISKLGEGGVGMVFLAEHMAIGRKVALKVLRPECGNDRSLVARFFTEARAVNRIGHEHIVDVTDYGTTPQGLNYFVMEHLTGESLTARLKQMGHIGLQRALNIGIQVADALAASHALSIVHRDLKSDNVFLIHRGGEHDYVKLLDFGIAKLLEQDPGVTPISRTGAVMGTPEYMSPEQCTGQTVDHRTDVYSLGIILYQMITGKLPFYSPNWMESLMLQVHGPIPSVREQRPELPVAFDDLVKRTLAKDREQRVQTMIELRDELIAFGDGSHRAPISPDVPQGGGRQKGASNPKRPASPAAPEPAPRGASSPKRPAAPEAPRAEAPRATTSPKRPATAPPPAAPAPAPSASERRRPILGGAAAPENRHDPRDRNEPLSDSPTKPVLEQQAISGRTPLVGGPRHFTGEKTGEYGEIGDETVADPGFLAAHSGIYANEGPTMQGQIPAGLMGAMGPNTLPHGTASPLRSGESPLQALSPSLVAVVSPLHQAGSKATPAPPPPANRPASTPPRAPTARTPTAPPMRPSQKLPSVSSAMTIPPDAQPGGLPDPGTGVTSPMNAVRGVAAAAPPRAKVTFPAASVSAAVTIPPESELAALRGPDMNLTPTPDVLTVARGPSLPSSTPPRRPPSAPPGAPPATAARQVRPVVPEPTASSSPSSAGQILAPTGIAAPRSRFGFWIAFGLVLAAGLIYLLIR